VARPLNRGTSELTGDPLLRVAGAMWIDRSVRPAVPAAMVGGPSRGRGRGLFGPSGKPERRARLTNSAVPDGAVHRAARHPVHPPRPKPGRHSEACSLRLDRRASRFAWCHAGRGGAEARVIAGASPQPQCQSLRLVAQRSQCVAPAGAAGRAGVPPRSPHKPPMTSEGDLWGDLQAVGRKRRAASGC
jgi:hypothetical protein